MDFKKFLKLPPGYYDLDGNLLVSHKEIKRNWDITLDFDTLMRIKFNCNTPGTLIFSEREDVVHNYFSNYDCINILDGELLVNAIIYAKAKGYYYGMLSDCPNLKNVYLEDERFLEESFEGSTSIKNVYIGKDNPSLESIDGVIYSKDRSILYYYPSGRIGTFIVPDSVKVIAEYAFRETNLSSIILPDGLKEFNTASLEGASVLKSILIPDSVERFFCWSEINTNVYVSPKLYKEMDGRKCIKEITLDALLEQDYSLSETNNILNSIKRAER